MKLVKIHLKRVGGKGYLDNYKNGGIRKSNERVGSLTKINDYEFYTKRAKSNHSRYECEH